MRGRLSKNRIFIDTTIMIYAFLDNEKYKHDKVVEFLSNARGKEVLEDTMPPLQLVFI